MEYPSTPVPSYSVSITARWKTLITPFDSGKEQRRQKQIQNIYDATLLYNRLALSDIGILWDFYQSCKGSLYAFYYYDLEENRRTWKDEYVAVGDGTTLIFDLSGKNTSAQLIYFNGALQGGGYSILTGGGSESADRVSFTTAPPAGTIITATFNGDLRIYCRFEEDKLSRENFLYRLFKAGLKLHGLPR